jgi:hypothetical protein
MQRPNDPEIMEHCYTFSSARVTTHENDYPYAETFDTTQVKVHHRLDEAKASRLFSKRLSPNSWELWTGFPMLSQTKKKKKKKVHDLL